jgi:hypothetical protein
LPAGETLVGKAEEWLDENPVEPWRGYVDEVVEQIVSDRANGCHIS